MKQPKVNQKPILPDVVKATAEILKSTLREKGFIESNVETMLNSFTENERMSPTINAELILSNWRKGNRLENHLKKYETAVRSNLGLPPKSVQPKTKSK